MKLKVFEAFAGYGSQSIALELLSKNFPGFQFEVVGFSEIDKYAIKAYHALHGDGIENLGDITKINWGGIMLILIYLHIHSLVKTSVRQVSSAVSPRGAAPARLSYGIAQDASRSNIQSFCLWRM